MKEHFSHKNSMNKKSRNFVSKEIEAVWSREIGRRVKDIESGKVKGIPANQVMAKARRVLEKARRS
jgi:hypothetical protein